VRDVPDARFVILGEGVERSGLERQIKELHLDKHVVLPGFHSDILAFIRAFDLFVMPSLSEGLGTSLLDAMASSKAIVASKTGGIPEVVVHGETGLLVPPRDHHALAEAIVRLLKDPNLRERMGHTGLERVKRVFSADRMVEQTLEVYRTHSVASHPDDTSHAAGTPSPSARG
jgi:glycosyltransferase involved in cell wall biosynthesis